jgi:seryl-tRNA synthetase
VAGHRGYYLTNDGIDLNQALYLYGLDFLRKRGYKKIQPPFFMNKEQMAKTAQLEQFDEELYKVGASYGYVLDHETHNLKRRSSLLKMKSI